MIIAHASDLHADFEVLAQLDVKPDLFVFTGDMLPNATRGHVHTELNYQGHWYKRNAWSLLSKLHNAPVLLVPGNHDYIDLAAYLRRDGVDAQDVTPQGVVFQGKRFSGFGHIPVIAGEWNREVSQNELAGLTQATMQSDPDVILTHAPPDGILNGQYTGNIALVRALLSPEHRVNLHLFGHSHEDGGRHLALGGILFVNSATTVQVIELL